MGEIPSGGQGGHQSESSEMADRLARGRHVQPHFHQPSPFKEEPAAVIPRSPEAQKAVDLGTEQHFDEMRRRDEQQKSHQRPT